MNFLFIGNRLLVCSQRFILSFLFVIGLFFISAPSFAGIAAETLTPEMRHNAPYGACYYNGDQSSLYQVDITGKTGELANNATGSVYPNFAPYQTNVIASGLECKCPSSSSSLYFTAQMSLPSITYNGRQYIKLNEYIAVGITLLMKDGPAGTRNIDIFNLNLYNNRVYASCGRPLSTYPATYTGLWRTISSSEIESATRGTLDLLILRPIVNNITFNGEIARLYAYANNSTVPGVSPWAIINLSVDVESNQQCSFNFPANHTISFGNIQSTLFDAIGVGGVVSGTEISLPPLEVQCDFDSNAINLAIVSDYAAGYPHAIKAASDGGTDSGVGVVIKSSGGTILSPLTQNMMTGSKINSRTYQFEFSSYLTKTRANVDKGNFKATATLQLSFN